MKIANIFIICALYAAASAPALASDEAIQTMADILVGMDHFPSAEQKAELDTIADDSDESEHLRSIARAISSIEHEATATDKDKLNAILADESATEAEKTLAGAVVGFEHKASEDDVAALKDLRE